MKPNQINSPSLLTLENFRNWKRTLKTRAAEDRLMHEVRRRILTRLAARMGGKECLSVKEAG
ncbi:MAG TPA: hypothetical protein VN578_12310 [Candidatus Binatia bacterium]|jgi:hypothetical protein|nr:hypothetical protein [Candidatus Binatia bacterium]